VSRAVVLALALGLAGCGYHLVHGGARDALGPFAIAVTAVRVPDAALAAAAEDGARAELAKNGELASDRSSAGSIAIDVLRVDETSEGIAVDRAAPNVPLARALRVTVTARARLSRAGSAAVERDTGDVRASEIVARPRDAASAVVARDEAARAAAQRLGAVLVRRLLGFPDPGDP
jgi:hypothetical protein